MLKYWFARLLFRNRRIFARLEVRGSDLHQHNIRMNRNLLDAAVDASFSRSFRIPPVPSDMPPSHIYITLSSQSILASCTFLPPPMPFAFGISLRFLFRCPVFPSAFPPLFLVCSVSRILRLHCTGGTIPCTHIRYNGLISKLTAWCTRLFSLLASIVTN